MEDVAKSVWDDFGKEAFHYFTIQVIEYGSSQTLNTVSQATDGWGTGTLLGILGENSSGDQTAQLDNISSQITVAQNMITGLKSDRDSFEGSVKQDFQQLAIADAALRLMAVKKSGWACAFPRMPFKTLMPSPSYNEICVFQQLAK